MTVAAVLSTRRGIPARRSLSARRITAPVTTVALLVGFAAATAIRMWVAHGRTSSPAAALTFVALLAGLVAVSGWRPARLGWSGLATGIGGALVLCLPPTLMRLTGHPGFGAPPTSELPLWAAVVVLVAIAEEAVLRGVLYDVVAGWTSEGWAIAVAAVAFAFMHVPLYGWRAVPLDLAVGVWLGALRMLARDPSAPAVAHGLADLAAWWLR